MKKKNKFLVVVVAIVLCFSVLAFCVYAVKKSKQNRKCYFQANNCKVRVLGKVENAVDANKQALTINPLTDDANTNQGKLIEGDVIWQVGDIYFNKRGEFAKPIVLKFEITNESDYAILTEINSLVI